MVIFTINELIDLVIMILAVGFIFKDSFPMPARRDYDPLIHRGGSAEWEKIKFSIMISAPAIALHEMGHKFVAMLFGIPAVFHASYEGLAIGVILKVVNFPFVFFVPGFVSHVPVSALTNIAIAFAGPGVNLALWLISAYLAPRQKNHKYAAVLYVSSSINMFLFIFNMIPIPFTDGGHVFQGLISLLFGGG